ECDDVPDGYAIIIVEDFGKGIPQDVIDRIFDRFYSERVEGISTGVGLELVRRMVEMHMGKISVSSVEASDGNPGNTRFTILLPLGRKHLNPEQIIEDYHTSEDQSLYKEDLLSTEIEDYRGDDENLPLNRIIDMTKEKPIMVIIEDNVEVCGFIKDLFSEMFRVESAYNGNEGWNVIRKVSPSIIISDIMMPEMDGMELCRLVKSDKRTCHIPVILLTARTAVTYKYEGLETGADDYIHKPFSADYLRHRVKNLILQRKLIQEHFLKSSLFKPEDLTVTSMDEKILLKAVRHIEENIADPKLNVDSLSREIGLSRVHFYRKIKSLTNLTAVEFIRVIRLKRAAQLLEKGSLDISEVRYAVGIQDAEYFRNSFRKQFKMTPREYAEKHALL
ncbi:MAG: hybrid sensor histidine kinase/response regulator, partial [Bacteroidetes bacterium]